MRLNFASMVLSSGGLTVLPCACVDLGRCVTTNSERSDLALAHDRHRYIASGFDAPQEIVTRL